MSRPEVDLGAESTSRGSVATPETGTAYPAPSGVGVIGELWWVRGRRVLAFRNAAVLYLFAVMFVVFSVWVPGTFLTVGTWRSLVSDQAISCLVAVGLVVPIAAGVVDLAIGTEVGLGAIVVARLLAGHFPIIPAIGLSLLAGVAVGVFSWLMITWARIPSFIATLGVSSLLAAAIAWVSASQQIPDLPVGFARLGTGQLFGLTWPFYIMIVVALVLWYVLERTPVGRRIYATGGNPRSASLAGIRTSRVVLGALVTGAVVASLAGVLETSQLAVGDPTIGPGYLLPVIAAVFLGSTQFRGGRFNIWGTVVAGYVLAVGVKGLQLAGLPVWIPDLFNGAALLAAVGLAAWRRTPRPQPAPELRSVESTPGGIPA